MVAPTVDAGSAGPDSDVPAAKRLKTDAEAAAAEASSLEGDTARAEAPGPASSEPRGTKSAPGDTPAQQQQQQQGRGKKGIRDNLIGDIHMAVKVNDLQRAMDLFRQAVAKDAAAAAAASAAAAAAAAAGDAAGADGRKGAAAGYGGGSGSFPRVVTLSLINSLMYVACGGEQWERYARGLPPLSWDEQQAAAAAKLAAAGQAASAAVEPQAADGDGQGGGSAAGGGANKQAASRGNKKPRNTPPPPPSGPPPGKEVLLESMDALWAHMQAAGIPPDQGTYLSLARIEAVKGNAQRALHWAQQCRQEGKHVQLRLFHPAMVCHALAGDAAAQLEVDQLICALPLDLTEYEYARLLEALAAGGTYAQFRAVLLRIQSDLNALSQDTIDIITRFFETSAAAGQAFKQPPEAALAPDGAAPDAGGAAAAAAAGGCPVLAAARRTPGAAAAWEVLRAVEVTASGRCEAAGGQLKVVDLEDEEWDSFAEAIADLARRQSVKPEGWDEYVKWLERNGPYDLLIDTANVAFFGQNFEGGGFNWQQVKAMWDMLREEFPDKRPLVMVHIKRTKDAEAQVPWVRSFLAELKRHRAFYYTPPGSNDDWYWMYATVRARRQGLLVSNDELRDHIWSLLRPKHFLKWKERHIAHYGYSWNILASTAAAAGTDAGAGAKGGGDADAGAEGSGGAGSPPDSASGGGSGGNHHHQQQQQHNSKHVFVLVPPAPFTSCVQQLESGAWMLPAADGSWTCVRPAGAMEQ